MPSHDRPVYYGVQATIKMKTRHKGGEWDEVGGAVWAKATWLHLCTKHKFRSCLKTFHPWSTLSFDFHPGLSIKIIQRMHFITELGAISRPLSFYLYQRRCFQGEHLDLRRQSMKWNAVSSQLCLLSWKVWGYLTACIVKSVCLREQQTGPGSESKQKNVSEKKRWLRFGPRV